MPLNPGTRFGPYEIGAALGASSFYQVAADESAPPQLLFQAAIECFTLTCPPRE